MADCNNYFKPSGYSETLCTSDIPCYDGGALQCVSITGNATLNQVIAAIDQAICNSLTTVPTHQHDAADITYSGTLIYSCFTMTATDVEAAIEELATEICNQSDQIANLCTDDIDLCNIDFTCLLGGVYYPSPLPTTVTGFENWVITTMCDIQGKLYAGGIIGGGYANRANFVEGSDMRTATNRMTRRSANSSWVDTGADILSNPASLVVTIKDNGGSGFNDVVVDGWYVQVADTVLPALNTNKDNYIDIDYNGNFIVTEVANGAPAPALAANSTRLWLAVTDGVGVSSTTDLRTLYAHDGSTFANDCIATRNVVDGNITNEKLDDIVAGATIGDSDFFDVTFNTKGRITAATSKINITAVADAQILQYVAAASEWRNADIVGTILPAGTNNDTLYYSAGSWVAASNMVNTGTNIGIGVSTGAPQELLTLGSGNFARQLPIVSGLSASPTGGGTLLAGTYYYVVVAYDGNDETVISAEISASVDGAVTNAIDIAWNNVYNAYRFRVYKGVATGVYTEYFEVTTNAYTDDGTAGTAGAPSHTTDTYAYGINIGNTIGVGVYPSLTTSILVNNIHKDVNIVLDVVQSAAIPAAPVDVYAGKFSATTANVGKKNYGIYSSAANSDTENTAGYFSAIASSAGDNIGLYLDVQNAGAGDAWSIWIENGGIASKNNSIISDVPTTVLPNIVASGGFGQFIWKDHNGSCDMRVVNSDNVSTGAYSTVMCANYALSTWDESISMSYYNAAYVRGGTPTTGVGFYIDRGVIKAGTNSDGLIFSVDNPTGDIHFEMNTKSKILINASGQVGVGIDDAGATAVNSAALLELNSTTMGLLVPRMTAAQAGAIAAPPDGLVLYVTTTDASFASVGFYGRVAGAWTNL